MNNNLVKQTKIYIAPTKDFLHYNDFPSGISSELKDITSKAVLSQKFAVWGLLSKVFKEFFNEEFDGSLVYKNQFGKPLYNKQNIYFSLSHSKDLVGVALSTNSIGFDIEKIDNDRVNDKLLNRVLNSLEIEEFSCDKFFDVWTKKEAIFKLNGNEKSFIPKNVLPDNYNTKTYSISYNNDAYSLSVALSVCQNVELFLLGDIKNF